MSGFQNIGVAILDVVQIVCVIGVIIALMMSVFKFMGHDMQRGFAYLIGVLIGAIVIGFAHQWAASLTGISM